MRSGVYKITNTLDGKIYIGSALNLDTRFKEHISAARANRHSSRHFQHAFNKYGEHSFQFSIIEECLPKIRLDREQHHLDFFKSYDHDIGYNIAKVAGRPPSPPNKPIRQTNIETGITRIFNTRDEAAAEGFNEGSITACCNGHMAQHKGFSWVFNDGSSPDFVGISRGRIIERTDLETGVIEKFKTASDIIKKYPEIEIGKILDCCFKRMSSYLDASWSFAKNETVRVMPLIAQDIVDVSSHISTPGIASPVIRIDPKTGAVKNYPSIAAAEAEGFGHVSMCCYGKRNSSGGYLWSFADVKLDIAKIDNIKNSKVKNVLRPIRRIDIATGEIKIYDKIFDVKLDGFSNGNVSECCNGHREYHRGYRWEFVDGRVEYKKPKNKIKRTARDGTGELIFGNTRQAAGTEFSMTKILECCNGKRKGHGGFLWSFA